MQPAARVVVDAVRHAARLPALTRNEAATDLSADGRAVRQRIVDDERFARDERPDARPRPCLALIFGTHAPRVPGVGNERGRDLPACGADERLLDNGVRGGQHLEAVLKGETARELPDGRPRSEQDHIVRELLIVGG